MKMNSKVKVGLILTVCLLACLVLQYFSAVLFDVIIFTLSCIGANEFYNILLKSGNPGVKWWPEATCFALFAGVIVSYLAGLSAIWYIVIAISIIVVSYLLSYLFVAYFDRKKTEKDEFRAVTNYSTQGFALFKANNTLVSIIYPASLLFFMYLINHLPDLQMPLFNANTAGAHMGLFGIILIFAICCLTDTFAMAFGSLIKGKKLCPKISPKKTVSGALFGLLGGVIGSVLTYVIFNAIYPTAFACAHFWQFLIVGLIGSVVAQAGDLFESVYKRKAGVKDSGDFFRSHGGVLDRLDSVCFGTPFVFVCILLIFA